MIQQRKALTKEGSMRDSRIPFALACLLSLMGFGTELGCVAAQVPGEDPKARAEYDLARVAFQQGSLREALSHVQASLQIDDADPDVHYLGSVILLAFCAKDEASTDCRFEDAERHARKALETAPEMRDAKNTLGVILVHEKKYDEAVAVLKPLAEDIVYGSPEKAWGNLGWAYLMRGNVDEAIVALRRALAAEPRFCVGSYRLGLAYEKKGEYSLAQDAFTKALETDRAECRQLQDGYAARARVAARAGSTDLVRADLERCRDAGPATAVGKRCAAELSTLQ
jgi:type IV pilus assembly protein PilF